jgi:hypothetical protein
MERMAESRRERLSIGRAQCAGRICGPVRLRSQLPVGGARDVTELVNHSTLLCHHQQQQEAYEFERLSHGESVSTAGNRYNNANRTPSDLQYRVAVSARVVALKDFDGRPRGRTGSLRAHQHEIQSHRA